MTSQNADRTPILREKAEQYLLISLISFAVSVILIRLFLYITGYPQIGDGELHIAHVLWGGLLLFAAGLLPLIFSNTWVLFWSALLNGVGVGLFIDEIGKFITQSNDYFYPAAAPIVYVFFLGVVFLYFRIRRATKTTPRAELYRALHNMTELLDNDLDENEKNVLIYRLEAIESTTEEKKLKSLARSLHSFMQNEEIENEISQKPSVRSSFDQLIHKIDRLITVPRLKIFLILGLGTVGILSAIDIVSLILFSVRLLGKGEISTFITPAEVEIMNYPIWFTIRVAVQGLVGLLSLVSAVLFIIKKDQRAIYTAILGLSISLTIVNILIFYLDQFSAAAGASLELLLLLGVLAYRRRIQTNPSN